MSFSTDILFDKKIVSTTNDECAKLKLYTILDGIYNFLFTIVS